MVTIFSVGLTGLGIEGHRQPGEIRKYKEGLKQYWFLAISQDLLIITLLIVRFVMESGREDKCVSYRQLSFQPVTDYM